MQCCQSVKFLKFRCPHGSSIRTRKRLSRTRALARCRLSVRSYARMVLHEGALLRRARLSRRLSAAAASSPTARPHASTRSIKHRAAADFQRSAAARANFRLNALLLATAARRPKHHRKDVAHIWTSITHAPIHDAAADQRREATFGLWRRSIKSPPRTADGRSSARRRSSTSPRSKKGRGKNSPPHTPNTVGRLARAAMLDPSKRRRPPEAPTGLFARMQVISLADRWHNEGLAARERREQQRLDLEAELALSLEGYVNLSSQTYAYPGRSYSPRTLSSAAQFDERHVRNASLARKTIVELDVHPTWRDLDERFKGEVKTVRDNRFGAANLKTSTDRAVGRWCAQWTARSASRCLGSACRRRSLSGSIVWASLAPQAGSRRASVTCHFLAQSTALPHSSQEACLASRVPTSTAPSRSSRSPSAAPSMSLAGVVRWWRRRSLSPQGRCHAALARRPRMQRCCSARAPAGPHGRARPPSTATSSGRSTTRRASLRSCPRRVLFGPWRSLETSNSL